VSPRCVMVLLPWKHVERLAILSAQNRCRLIPCSLRPTRSPWVQCVLLPMHAASQTCTGAKPMLPDQLQALAARALVRAGRQPRRTALVPSLFFSPPWKEHTASKCENVCYRYRGAWGNVCGGGAATRDSSFKSKN